MKLFITNPAEALKYREKIESINLPFELEEAVASIEKSLNS